MRAKMPVCYPSIEQTHSMLPASTCGLVWACLDDLIQLILPFRDQGLCSCWPCQRIWVNRTLRERLQQVQHLSAEAANTGEMRHQNKALLYPSTHEQPSWENHLLDQAYP